MLSVIIEVILIFTIPYIILRCQSFKPIALLGTVGTAYLVGIIYSLLATEIFPARDSSVTEILLYFSISLAIPLLLFSNNMKKLAQVSGKILLSFLLLVISVFTATIALFLIFTRNVEEGEILSGMAVALYTGGTPNLNAVACMFHLDNTLLLMSNLSDVIFGGLFYVFLIFAAKPLLSRFLNSKRDLQVSECNSRIIEAEASSFSFRNTGVIRNLLLSLLITIASLGVGLLIWVMQGQTEGTMVNYVVPALMIGTTIGGVIFSFNDKISSVRENEVMGNYFATVFSYAIASIIDISKIGDIYLQIFAVFAVITGASFIIHALLCKIFRIGADTMIITATAGIYGPAFIPSISKAIDAEYMLASGLIVGALGYTIGTFLGIACTYSLALFV